MRFYGNEICCGSYACLNAMRNSAIDVKLFEISTSTPFGIKHYENNQFDRLLTTYCDPNKGLDAAIELWGYSSKKFVETSVKEAVKSIKEKITPRNRIVLGPIDMGELSYHVMPQLFKRMDHYVTLEYASEEEVYCFDSEGISGFQINFIDLEKYISVKEVEEAENKITFRIIGETGGWSKKDILIQSYKQANYNLLKAEKEGEGSYAIERCFEFLQDYDNYKWKLSLQYDIQYLLQRKWLFNVLIEEYEKVVGKTSAQMLQIVEIIEIQKKVIGYIYNDLRKNGIIEKSLFKKLSTLEKELGKCAECEYNVNFQ